MGLPNVVVTRVMSRKEVFDSCLQHLFSLVKYKKDKDKFFEYLQNHRDEMKKMDKYELEALKLMIGGEKQLARMRISEEGGEEDVCQAIEELIEDGRIEGRIEGRMQLLIGLICKKLQKGKDVQKIAEELEEEESIIQKVCDFAMEFAPEYDVEKIVEAWIDKNC